MPSGIWTEGKTNIRSGYNQRIKKLFLMSNLVLYLYENSVLNNAGDKLEYKL